MRLPDSITVNLTRDERPVADLLVQLVFHTRDKGDLGTLPRATDATGTAAWTRADIDADEATAKELMPRDTPILEKHGLERVTAVVWGNREIEWATKAVEVWDERGNFPEGYLQLLERGAKAVDRIADGDVDVAVVLDGDSDAEDQALDTVGESRIHAVYTPSYEVGLLEGWPLVSDRNS